MLVRHAVVHGWGCLPWRDDVPTEAGKLGRCGGVQHTKTRPTPSTYLASAAAGLGATAGLLAAGGPAPAAAGAAAAAAAVLLAVDPPGAAVPLEVPRVAVQRAAADLLHLPLAAWAQRPRTHRPSPAGSER